MNGTVVAAGPMLPIALGRAIRTSFRDLDFSVLVKHLEASIGHAVTGIVVYGSTAWRLPLDEIGDSDVDLLVMVEEAASGGIFGRADGVEIDLHVQSRSATLADPLTNWIYAEGRVLFDTNPPELEGWLDSLRTWKTDNADPWNDADHLRNRVWAHRLVERVIRLGAQDPVAAAMHEARLLAAIPTLHAQVKRRHTSSISHWWAGLAREDASFANTLAAYFSRRVSPPDGLALKRVVDELYELNGTPAVTRRDRARDSGG